MGLFVAVEGIDHSGKTTLTHALCDRLRTEGLHVGAYKEPTSGPVGVLLRQLSTARDVPALALALLSAADRHHQQTVLNASVASCDVVVSDRYFLSGLAYHLADGIDPHLYLACAAGVRVPDLYVFLDIDPAVAAARVTRSPDSRWEEHAITDRLVDAYTNCLRLVATAYRTPVVRIDAAQPPRAVLAEAAAAVTEQLARHEED